MKKFSKKDLSTDKDSSQIEEEEQNLIKIDFLLIWHEMVVLPFVVTNVN